MSTGEDEASPRNGRLRPRRSLSTCTPNPLLRAGQKTVTLRARDRPKRSSTSSKASSVKQDDLSTKSDTATPHLFLCPYCDSTFHARQTASKHARRIHLSPTKQDNFIKCLYCHHTDADSNSIIKHMVDSHPNQYFACLDCHTRFPSTTELAEHKLNVCDKQKLPYRCKLRQKPSTRIRKNPKNLMKKENVEESNKNAEYTEDISFNGIVISCELKPSETHDAADIEDKITTNLILPSAKTSLANTGMDKSAVIVLDDLQWNKRIPPNFSFHNTDADQILSRLGVVHRSPRVGESKKDLIRLMDEPNEKFEKCFDTSFYSKVTKNVQENLAKFVDGTLNFNPNKDSTIKTRKSKASVLINTAEGFPILLAPEQFSRHLFDGFMPRALAPKHKWKWDSTENDKSLMMLLDQTKRDSHVNNCIITLISGLDIWTQLRMKSKFDEIFKTAPAAKKAEKQNKIGMELKEILESRDIPTRVSPVVQVKKTAVDEKAGLELPSYLGLSASRSECSLQPAVLSGEWVRPRCFVCCACGEQTSDARALTSHLATQHPYAQVQHYEIVGETLLSADILKHLYVPLTQMSNRTRPPRGFRDCTKCKKSVTLEDLHQHMLECAGDTPAVRRKCRYRPFGVRRRRPRLPDNIIRKKMRKDIRARRRQKSHIRPRPRNRTEVGDAETIRKMIADLPAKRNRITPTNVLRPKRTIVKVKKQVAIRATEDKNQRPRKCSRSASKITAEKVDKKHNDTDNSSTIDEDDQPLKVSATRIATRSGNGKQLLRRTITINKNKKKKPNTKKENKMEWSSLTYDYSSPQGAAMGHLPYNYSEYFRPPIPYSMALSNVCPAPLQSEFYQPSYCYPNCLKDNSKTLNPRTLREMRRRKIREEDERYNVTGRVDVTERFDVPRRVLDESGRDDETESIDVTGRHDETEKFDDSEDERIDVTSSCSSNGRQYSGVDDNSTRRSMGHPTDPREGGHQNNSVSQMPNLPLKHSIASLTSVVEEPDSLTHYVRPCILPSHLNQNFAHGSLERKDFENEVTVEKVDKPPLSNNSAMENYMTFNSARDSSRRLTFAHDAVGPRLPHAPIKLQASAGQLSLPCKSTALDGSIPPDVRQQLILDQIQESNDNIEDLSISKDTAESEDKKTDGKVEINRIKTNKVRKVLNIENCIAKIRTKKGLPINKIDSEMHDPKNPDSESQNVEKTAEVPAPSSSPKPEHPLDATNTTLDSEETKNNCVTKEECIKKQSSKTQDINVNHQLPDKSEVLSHEKKTPLNNANVPLTQTQREAKPELSITKSVRRPVDEIIKNTTPKQISPTESYCETPGINNEFMLHLSRLISFWSSQKIEHSVKNTKILVKNTLQKLMDLNIPGVTEAIPKIQEQVSGHSDEVCMEILYNCSVSSLYQKFNRQFPEGNELYNDINKAHASVAMFPVPTSLNPAASQLLVAHNTENAIEENTLRQTNDSPTSRRTRRKPSKKTSAKDQNVRSSKKQSKQMVSMQLSPRGDIASQFDSNAPAVFSASHLKLALPDAQHLRTPSLHAPYPPNIRARRDSYRRISNSSDTCPNVYETREVLRASPTDIIADKIQQQLIMDSLRRQSFEAYAQSEMANYNNYALQTYRMEKQKQYERLLKARTEYERSINYSEQPHPGPEILHKTRESEHFRQEESLYPLPTLPQIDLDVLENVPGVRKAMGSNQVDKSKAQDRYGSRIVSSEVNKSKSAERFDVCACGIACHDTPEATRLCNFNRLRQQTETKILDSNPPRVLTPRSSDVYSRASVSNIDLLDKPDSTNESRLNENTVNPDNFSHVYLEPLPPFEPPLITKLPVTHDPQPANVDEDAPLDLSCVSRKEQTFDNLQASDLSINMCIKDRQNDDTSITSRRNIENLRTHSHHIAMPKYAPRFESADDFTREESLTQQDNAFSNVKEYYPPGDNYLLPCIQASDEIASSQHKLCENDTSQSEQDAETARKIAMLPKELVQVLGQIPKDHRNQLLNILPQYVSAPVTNVETEKRHSPSHSRGSQIVGESQSTTSLLAPSVPTLSPHAPIGKNEGCHSGSLTSDDSTDINKHHTSRKVEVNYSTGISTSVAIPTQLSTCKLPEKQKASNEQTASLRAVRIKTTSAKKSFYEDKKSLVNSAFKTNTGVDETDINPNVVLQDNTNTSDLKQDDGKVYNKQIISGTHVSEEVTKETSSVLVHHHVTNCDVQKEKEYISVNIEKKESETVTMLDKTQEIDCQVVLQTASNKCLSQVTDSSIDNNRVLQPELSLTKPPVRFSVSDVKDKMIESTPPQSPCDNRDLNNRLFERLEPNKHQNNVAGVESDIKRDSEPSAYTDMAELKQNVLLFASTVLKKDINNELKRATEEPNEEDSEDDIALAVIKQKKSSVLVMRSKDSGKINKIKNNKQKQNCQRKTSKRCKNICSMKSSSPDSVSESTSSEIHNATHNEDETKRDTITKFVDTSNVTDLDSVKVKEVKEKTTCLLPESNESDIDSLNGKNYSVESNVSRKNEKAEENQNLTNLDNPSNTNDENSKHTIEIIKEKSDNKNENDFNLIVRNPISDDIKRTSSLKLCTKITNINAIPLRRSRRGKSMYVESSYLEDTEKNEDNAKATPLTMKRLILSRVEKDKKRISESIAIETELADVVVDESKMQGPKKGKRGKRKKSPNVSSQKKSRSSSTCEINDDKTDTGNVATEKKSLILRGLHDSESKIPDDKSCKNYVKCCDNATAVCSCCEDNNLVSKEKDTETSGDNLIETSDTSKSLKQNVYNLSELNSAKSNTKYSDDDKVLLETKQSSINASVEKNTLSDQDIDIDKSKEQNITQESTLRLHEDNVYHNTADANIPVDTRKTCYSTSCKKSRSSSATIQDRIDMPEQRDPYAIEFDELLGTATPIAKKKCKVSQSVPDDDKVLLETKQSLINNSFTKSSLIDQDVKGHKFKDEEITREPTRRLDKVTDDIPITDLSISVETRKTCYSRSVPSKKPRSSSATIKSSARIGTSELRDPYDFDDMQDTAKPIVKKKGKVNQSSKLTEHKAVKSDDLDSPQSKASKQVPSITIPQFSRESDSDSSKSDVPLQKYVEEKELEYKNKYANRSVDKLDENEKVCERKDDKEKTFTKNECPDQASSINNEIKCKSTKRASIDDYNTFETPVNTNVEYFESNVMSTEDNPSKHKLTTNNKKSRRAPTETKDDTVMVNNEVEKLRSEKGWIEFGSCLKTRRKSNLLATKKISETFHLISNEIDDYSGYKEKSKKSNENKKKMDISCTIPTEESKTTRSEGKAAALNPVTSEDTNFVEKSIEAKTDFVETNEANEPEDVQKMHDSDLDSLTAQAIMDSEEVRNLENDLFSGLREAAKANASRNCFMSYQSTSVENTNAKNDDLNDPVPMVDESHSLGHISESPKKSTKDKAVKPPGYKAKMYPDVEEFDMFEDKFDKIKRKRRSQAVAAKQQVTVEPSSRSQTRKQSERKRIAKTSKKSHQSGLVPTKGALKGFECIKISIPTQDLNLPMNVSPPRQPKKRRKTTTKRRKEPSDFESSCSDFDDGDKQLSVRDIYEFKDSEDAELFDLRPSTVMDRFRSMHSKSKSKYKDREKFKEDRVKSRDRHKRKTELDLNLDSKVNSEKARNMNKSSAEDQCVTEKGDRSESEKNTKSKEISSTLSEADSLMIPLLVPSDTEEYCGMTKKRNPCEKIRIDDEISDKKDSGDAVAATSLTDEGNRVRREKCKRKIDLTSFDSKPDNKKTCIIIDNNKCSARDPDKRDRSETGHRENKLEPVEKNYNINETPSDDENYCGKTKKENQCENSRNDGEDNVKKDSNDAVPGTSGFVPDRMDESDYESEMSSPEGDFIFYTSNDVNCACPSENETDDSDTERGCGRLNCLNKNKNADKNTAIGNIFKNNAVRCEKSEVKEPIVHKQDLDQLFDSLLETEKQPNDMGVNAESELEPSAELSVRAKTSILPDKHHDVVKSRKYNVEESLNSKSYQPAQPTRRHESKNKKLDENKPSKSGYGSPLCLWESDLPQIFSDAETPKDKTQDCKIECPQENVTHIRVDNSPKTVEKHSKTNNIYGDDYIDFSFLFEIPASTCAQTDSKIDESVAETGNESAATKYLKGLGPSEAANMEIHTTVSLQGTQTEKSSGHETGTSKHGEVSAKDEAKLDERIVPKRRIRLPKRDRVCEILQKPKSTKNIETQDKSEKFEVNEFRSDYESADETGVARQRARRKCTVGKQNVLAEHWSSESEVEVTSAASTVAGAPHRKRRRKREERHSCSKRAGKGRPRGPNIRVRAPRHCWSSSDEAEAGPPPQHGWIVGDSHKKLVTMLAHAKGRKRTHDRRAD